MWAFKFLAYFVISFFILCIPIKDHRVFDEIYIFAIPHTKKIINNVKKETLENIKKGKNLSKKYLLNIGPEQIEDSVSNAHAAAKNYIPADLGPLDEYTIEEKEILKKILNESQKE